MTTDDKRKLTSRLNSLHSTGPKTPEGKSKSARNSTKHGAYAKTLILPGEKLADYHELVHSHLQLWAPTNLIEENLVREMATTLWRLRRQAPAESSLIGIQIQRMATALSAEFEAVNAAGLYALAFTALHSHGDGPAQISRQERRLLHQYQQLRQELLILREQLPPTTPQPNPELTPPENEPVETKLTDPPDVPGEEHEEEPHPLPLLASATRVQNPHSPLYAALPPLTQAPAQTLSAN